MTEQTEAPGAAPVGGAVGPFVPDALRRVSGNPAGGAQTAKAVLHDRGQCAAHPGSERQGEALFLLRNSRWRQAAIERGVQQAFTAQPRGVLPERRPDRGRQFVIDVRHADLEAVRHCHHVDITQQLRLKVEPRLHPRDSGRRGFRADGIEARVLDAIERVASW